MSIRPTRRNFLCAAPMAAVAGFSLAEQVAFASGAEGAAPEGFELFTAAKIAEKSKALQAKPGNDNLFEPKSLPVVIVLTTEVSKAAKEFEWHEGRDHILQVLEGTTRYDVGGTPKGAHSAKPGEWNAPEAVGSESVVLKAGDMLVIPRGTLHRRTTEGSVTFTLISTSGVVKG